MATPDLAALQAQVEQLKRDYTDLTKKPASLFDVSNPIKAAAAIKSLTDQIELAKEKASRLEEGFGGIYETVVAIVGELKKNNTQADLATKAFGKIQSITQKLKYDQQGISELSLKELKNNKKKLESLQSEVISQAKSISDKYKGTKFENESLLLNKKGEELNKSQLKVRATSLGLTVQQLKEEASILEGYKEGFTVFTDMNKELTERLNLEKKVQSGLGITGGLLKGISKIPIIGDMFDASDAVEEMEAHLREVDKDGKQINSNTSALKVGLKNVKGQIIDGLLNPANLIVGVFTLMVETLKGTDSAIGDLAKGFDMSYNSAANLRMELTDIANFSMDVAVTTKGLQESMMAIGQTLGSNARLNSADLVTFTKLREQAGYTNDELAGIQKLTLATGGSLEDNTASFLGSVAALNGQNKLTINAKQLLKEVANVSDSIKLSIGGTTEKLAEAAFKAKQFGINLLQADQISQSLLDFESSIGNELSAELITGKDLNLEKARLLAINGDIAGASAEILKQVGGTAEFTKMNRIQQEALAKATGLSRDDLAKSLMDKEALVALSGVEGKDAKEKYDNLVRQVGVEEAKKRLGNEALANQFQQQSVQERFAQSIEKLKELFVSIAGPILAIISPIVDVLSPIIGVIAGTLGTLVGWLAKGLKFIIDWGKYLLPIYGVYKGIQIAQKSIVGWEIASNAQKQIAANRGLAQIGANRTILALEKESLVAKIAGNLQLAFMLIREQGLNGLKTYAKSLDEKSLARKILMATYAGLEFVKTKATVVWEGIKNTLLTISNNLKLKGIALTIKDAYKSIAAAAMTAYQSAAKIPVVGWILGGVAAAAVVGLGASLISKGNDVVSPGYGKRTLMSPEGAITLNDKDTVIAGTNLGGKGNSKGNSQQSAYMDPALLNEMRAMRQEQARSNNKPTIVENSMNGTKFGTSVHMNTYKIQ